MLRILFVFALLSPLAHAVPESDFGPAQALLDNQDGFFTHGAFPGKEKLKIVYTRFGNDAGENGCLVIVPGKGEPSLKYLEVAHDLHARGFSPIYSIDHRGQGFSDRVLPDRQKNSVRRFGDYVADLDTFVNRVVLRNPACRGHHLSMLAHSMGGAIATLYLEKLAGNNPFHKVALSSPMVKIQYPGGRTENSVIFETWVACFTPFGPSCDDYTPGEGPYNPNSAFEGNSLTHSALRFTLKKDVDARWPALQIGGPTVRWARAAALADRQLRWPQEIRRISAPLLILQAGEDSLVDNSGQDEVCEKAAQCRLERFPGARHEILMESDSIRDHALDLLTQFLR